MCHNSLQKRTQNKMTLNLEQEFTKYIEKNREKYISDTSWNLNKRLFEYKRCLLLRKILSMLVIYNFDLKKVVLIKREIDLLRRKYIKSTIISVFLR